MRKRLKLEYLIGVVLIIFFAFLCFTFLGGYSEKVAGLLSNTDMSSLDSEAQVQAEAVASGRSLGILSIIPVLITVALAFTLKDVLISLIAGILSGYAIWWGAFGNGNFLIR